MGGCSKIFAVAHSICKGEDKMGSFIFLLLIFLVLIAAGIPVARAAFFAFAAAMLVLLLWVGVQVLTLFLCLIPTVIVGVLAAKLAEHLGCRKEMAEKIGIIATLPCLYYFFF